jgi:inhibitor of KinA sporulation pathway (predicted exonuclease)
MNKYNIHAKSFHHNLFNLSKIFSNVDKIICNGHDKLILVENINLNKLKIPKFIDKFHDIRPFFGKYFQIPEEKVVSSNLLNMLGLKNNLRSHDALDDTKSIYLAINYLLKKNKISISDLLES